MLASPTFLMGSVLATVWAAIFHLLFGRRGADLILAWFVALIGFGVGQLMGGALGLPLVVIGRLHLIEASLACWVAMGVAHWLKM
ncbi:MAG: hypothetical protein V1772_06425 [Chloroflexota bacterium]